MDVTDCDEESYVAITRNLAGWCTRGESRPAREIRQRTSPTPTTVCGKVSISSRYCLMPASYPSLQLTREQGGCLMSSAARPCAAPNLYMPSPRHAHPPLICKPGQHALSIGAFRFAIKHAGARSSSAADSDARTANGHHITSRKSNSLQACRPC
ncbi:hypothetical protein AUEXF2481DRAFT_611451 [Aureobasidium subglaciale EXF-2481]|uniref:Uncharacterized protein n=1 Tax=Aureobasidium subglaciale (strain EXF-2481) TaxID=1043005 RepID=A0A074YGB4_AURSE|nr:uncharacterized protein AUEXF2481DRAFT_611451 [Aureobasidium subglaciale EXF-2481]KEQ96765.1 hypothetical protein AUEXF2481DRAFT_611451 [Aureobasidium subglaciale EXF-2481]